MTKEEVSKLCDEYKLFADNNRPRIDDFNRRLQRVKNERDWVALKDFAKSLVEEIRKSKFRGMVLDYVKKERPEARFKHDMLDYRSIEHMEDLSGVVRLLTTVTDDAKISFVWPGLSKFPPIHIPLVGKTEGKLELVEWAIILDALPDC